MIKEEREVRKHFVKTRMNDTELNQLIKLHQKSTDKDISSYIRKVLLQKPVTIAFRNISADEHLAELVELKKELNAIGNNFNQVVHKLHLLDKIPEFRIWVTQYENLHKSLVAKVEEIKIKMYQLHDLWLQK